MNANLVDRYSLVKVGNQRTAERRSAIRHSIQSVAGLILIFFTSQTVGAQTINIGSETDLNNAIQTINSNPTNTYTLNFTSGFSLNQPVLQLSSQATVNLAGNSVTIDGGGLYQPLIVESGTVKVQNLNIINAGSPITVDGGTLNDTTGSLQSSIVNMGTFEFSTSNAETYGGIISGPGGVAVNGSGPVTFTGANTYGGGTVITGGSTLIGTTSTLQGTMLNFGVLQFNQSTAGTYAGSLQGTGFVKITGGGPITFTGLNTNVGGILVDTGNTLIGTTSSLSGPIGDNGTLRFDQSTSGTYSDSISGTGTVQITGGGTVTFTGTNAYTGGTLIEQGSTLVGTTSSLQGAITDLGKLEFNQSTSGSFNGTISGTGSVKLDSGANLVFTGLHSYSGGTTIDSGATLSGTARSLQGSILNNGNVIFIPGDSASAYSGNMSGTGHVKISENATTTLSGTNSYTGGTTVESGGKLIGTTSSIQGSVLDNGIVVMNGAFFINNGNPNHDPLANATSPSNIFHGTLTGTGKLEIAGGVVTLTGANTYTGGTTVDSNSVLNGTTIGIQGNIENNGFVGFDNGATPTNSNGGSIFQYTGVYSGNITGSGGVQVSGATPIYFAGTNSYTGGTYLDSGSVLIGTTSSLQGNIINNGSLYFSQFSAIPLSNAGTDSVTANGPMYLNLSAAGTYAGNLSGIGSVTIEGGPVTFAGTNTYTGGTFVHTYSTLIGTTKSLQGAISNSGLVVFNQSNEGTFAGVISGSGNVEVSGLGTTIFSNANTYTGLTTIDNGGTLFVSGSVLGNVDVANSGTLTGTGSVGSTTVDAGGTIAPGGIGTALHVKGDFTQGAGSTFVAELSPTGSNKLIVDGTAKIENATKLNIKVDPGTLTVGTKYEVLTAGGGLTGQYSNLLTPALTQQIVFSENYGANNLILVVNSNLSQYVQVPNQLAVAQALDRVSGTATGDFANAITQLTILDSAPLSNALNQLSGDIYGSIGTIERQTTTTQLQLISNRLATLTAPGTQTAGFAQRPREIRLVSRQSSENQANSSAATVPTPQGWTTWAQGYGLGGTVAGDSNAGGLNYRLGGTLFGTERWLGDNFMIGVLGGYAATGIGNRMDGSSAQVSAYQVGLYQLFRQDALYVSNIDAYGNSSYDVTRPVNFGNVQQTASGSSIGNQWAHYTEAGINQELDEFRFQPFLGVQYMYLAQNGYSESGAGSLDLTTNQQIINSLRGSVGARIYHETTWNDVRVIPMLAARYQHEFGDGTQLVSSSFAGAPTSQFVVAGNSTGRDFGLITLSTTAYLTPRLSIFGSVDTQFASRYSAVIGAGGLQYTW